MNLKHETESRADVARTNRRMLGITVAMILLAGLVAFMFSDKAHAHGHENRCEYTGLYNISTRGYVGTKAEQLIGGFIIKASKKHEKLCVVIRGRGQSLPGTIPNRIEDPQLKLWRLSGRKVLGTNDDWADSEFADIIEDTFPGKLAPTDAGMFVCLKPGNYTANITGVGGGTGVGIVEVVDILFEDRMGDLVKGCRYRPRDDDDDDDHDDDDDGRRCNEDDHDRGHGNDCDGDDEDNPGRGKGKGKGKPGG